MGSREDGTAISGGCIPDNLEQVIGSLSRDDVERMLDSLDGKAMDSLRRHLRKPPVAPVVLLALRSRNRNRDKLIQILAAPLIQASVARLGDDLPHPSRGQVASLLPELFDAFGEAHTLLVMEHQVACGARSAAHIRAVLDGDPGPETTEKDHPPASEIEAGTDTTAQLDERNLGFIVDELLGNLTTHAEAVAAAARVRVLLVQRIHLLPEVLGELLELLEADIDMTPAEVGVDHLLADIRDRSAARSKRDDIERLRGRATTKLGPLAGQLEELADTATSSLADGRDDPHVDLASELERFIQTSGQDGSDALSKLMENPTLASYGALVTVVRAGMLTTDGAASPGATTVGPGDTSRVVDTAPDVKDHGVGSAAHAQDEPLAAASRTHAENAAGVDDGPDTEERTPPPETGDEAIDAPTMQDTDAARRLSNEVDDAVVVTNPEDTETSPVNASDAPKTPENAKPNAEESEDDEHDVVSLAPDAGHVDSALEPTLQRDEEGPISTSGRVLSTELLASLLNDGRLGLTAWFYEVNGHEDVAPAVRALALARALRTSTGGCLPEFMAESGRIPALADPATAEVVRLLLTAAAVRATSQVYYSALDLLGRLRTDGDINRPGSRLAQLADRLHNAAARGVDLRSLLADTESAAMDVGEDDFAVEASAAIDQANHRHLVYHRATEVYRSWMSEGGELHAILEPVASKRTADSQNVRAAVERLRKTSEVEDLIDRTDASVNKVRGRHAIEARARERLRAVVDDALDIAGAWLDAFGTTRAAATGQDAAAHLDELRTAIHAIRATLEAEVSSLVDDSPQPHRALAVHAGADLLGAIDDLLEGRVPVGRERAPARVLNLELLKAPSLRVEALMPPSQPTIEDLVAAANCSSWQTAIEQRIEALHFAEASSIVAVLDTMGADDEHLEGLQREVDRARESAGHRLAAKVAKLRALLGTARRQRWLDEVEVQQHEGSLARLDLEGQDLYVAEQTLDAIVEDVEERRAAAIELTRAVVEQDLERVASRSWHSRIHDAIDEGDLVTATELRSLALDDRSPAESENVDHGYERMVAKLTSGNLRPIDLEFVKDLVSKPGDGPDGAVSDALVGHGLRSWVEVMSTPYRDSQDEKQHLADVFGLLGLQVPSITADNSRRDGKYWNWVGLRAAAPIGGVTIHDFGSTARGVYRVLLHREKGAGDVVRLLSSKDLVADEPTIVLHRGLLTPVEREQLRQQSARIKRAVVIDDAIMQTVAIDSPGDFDRVLSLALPCAAMNPYRPFVAGQLPPEMFFGRDRELQSIIDRDGTSFIYGGRQLGKSVLLQAAKRAFERSAGEGRATYLDLKSKEIGTVRGPRELWGLVTREMFGRDHQDAPSAESFSAAVLDHLAEEGGRLLLLLDEADGFLEADADIDFETVAALKGLMEESRRDFKVVFAGLHQVQRFMRHVNQPLAHLGNPLSIGPLQPQPASDLLRRPMEALGFRFEGSDVVDRIMAYANYQPSILQLFAHHLVDRAFRDHRATAGRLVTADLVEAVYSEREFARTVRQRFDLTINLDPRYRVIADVVAMLTYEGDVDFAWADIGRQARELWPTGFGADQHDQFRSLLDELIGLGILSERRPGRYGLRSPNILRMLGTRDEIETRLLSAQDSLSMPNRFERDLYRRSVENGRAPLTEQQLGDVLRLVDDDREDLAIVVIGTPAVSVDGAASAIESAGRDSNVEVRVKAISPEGFPAQTIAAAAKRGVLLVGDLTDSEPGPLDAILGQAERARVAQQPPVALVLRPDQAVFLPDDFGARQLRCALWTSTGLRMWLNEVELATGAVGFPGRVREATGGWPHLVRRFEEVATSGGMNPSAALDEVERLLTEDDAFQIQHLDLVGLTSPDLHVHLFRFLVEENDSAPVRDTDWLAEFLGAPEAAVATAAQQLEMSALLSEPDAEGFRSVEPVTAAVWLRRTD